MEGEFSGLLYQLLPPFRGSLKLVQLRAAMQRLRATFSVVTAILEVYLVSSRNSGLLNTLVFN
jgi:hypothetical protein